MEPGKKKKRSKAASGSRRSSKSKSSSYGGPSSSAVEQKPISINALVLLLNEVLSVENASIDRIQSRIGETSIPNLKARLQRHLEETVKQKNRLERLIKEELRSGEPTKEKAQLRIPSPPKELFDEENMNAYSELLKLREDGILTSIVEEYYRLLLAVARSLPLPSKETIHSLSQNFNEETSMRHWLNTNIPTLISEYKPGVGNLTINQRGEEDRGKERRKTDDQVKKLK
jgi:ferritin-like metal-binding protein YciE